MISTVYQPVGTPWYTSSGMASPLCSQIIVFLLPNDEVELTATGDRLWKSPKSDRCGQSAPTPGSGSIVDQPSTPVFDDCVRQPEYGDCLIRGVGNKCGKENATAASAARCLVPLVQAEGTWLIGQAPAALLPGTLFLTLVSLHYNSRSPLRVLDGLRDGISPASFSFVSQFLEHLFRRNTNDRTRFHLVITT